MTATPDIGGYIYRDAAHGHAHSYLLPTVRAELRRLGGGKPMRVFDLGCGNGSVAASLAAEGYDVTGIDASEAGIAEANAAYPNLRLQTGSAYDDLAGRFGQFPVVISLEVVEHLYAPRNYVARLFDLVEPGGSAVISTPYHGYLKNLALAITGRMDAHFTALWDHGHIKFWSVATLTTLLTEAGFESPRLVRVGRIPPLARSMIAVVRRPLVPDATARTGVSQDA